MKSTFRFLAIIVFAAVIGFSFVSCNFFGDLFGGKEEEQETQTTYTQTPGGQIPGGEQPGGEQPGGEQPGADPTHTHQYGEWLVTTHATCVATGVETRTCALDPSHTETQIIPIDSNAHVLGPNAEITKQPTCTETGLGTGTCTLNPSHVLKDAVLSALGHDYSNWQQTTTPTCTTAGVETGTCTRDQVTTTRTGAAIDPNAHDWNTSRTTISTVTATTDGIQAITCKHNSSHTKDPITTYATGTPGLSYTRINNNTEYSVRNGTVKTGAVHIPAYYRPNANSAYLPVTEIGDMYDELYYDPRNPQSTIGAFLETNITAVTFAENSQLKYIYQYAFASCTSLTSITIPASVTSINSNAFSGCTGLTGITVAANNPNYSSEGGILYNKTKTTINRVPPAGISGTFTIPTSVTSIGAYAFSGCKSLTGITIPGSVTSISSYAFSGCTGLTGITIPASVTSISNYAFSDCTGLTSVTIPQGVTSIGNYAFSYCSNLTSVTIPASVTSIGYCAFWYCTGLTSITIPAGVTSIGQQAFSKWTASQTINIQGKANQAAADAAWGADWRFDCSATINYSG
jgi:hypothetical protein